MYMQDNGNCFNQNENVTTLLDDSRKDHVVIGEAALILVIIEREISVLSLIDALAGMARLGGSDIRQAEINKAINWLKSFDEPEKALLQEPYLKTLAGLNDEMS